jgi:hypothetical protein
MQLGGSGGGGSGGGLHVKAGGQAILDGIIDLRGGRGGPTMGTYYSDYYFNSYAKTYGTVRHGGDGGLGRLVIEAANLQQVSELRVLGQFMSRKVDSLPTTNMGLSTTPNYFKATQTGNITHNFGNASAVRFSEFKVHQSATITLTGTKDVRVFVDGDIDIKGKIIFDGAEKPRTTAAYNFGREFILGSAPDTTKSDPGTLGGGAGGDPTGETSTNNLKVQGKIGSGPAGGLRINNANTGYKYSSYYYWVPADGGPGGGGNGSAGEAGWAPYGLHGAYNFAAYKDDTSGNGVAGRGGADGGSQLDSSTLTITNSTDTLSNFVGSGGGGGSSGFFSYSSGATNWQYFGRQGVAGNGAGAFALIGSEGKQFSVSGQISAQGGDGNQPGMSLSRYSHAGGGGGSGGTVYLIGDMVNIAPVTTSSNDGAGTGATFDLRGGRGGGWREYQPLGVLARFPAYNSWGQYGGMGGYGRLVVDYKTSFNGSDAGVTAVNRWGMEETIIESDDLWSALAGSFHTKCFGEPKGGVAQSKWYDFKSVRPILTGVSSSRSSTLVGNLEVEGAQSDPHAVGDGTGAPDSNNTTGRMIFSSQQVGPRWWRFYINFTRTSGTALPTLNNVRFDYETDADSNDT